MTDETTERAELRELLLDGVIPPSDAAREAMFDRTFAAGGADGAHLLPPDDLFDEPTDPTAEDELPLDELDAYGPDGADDHVGGDDASAIEWSDPADATPAADLPDPAVDTHPLDPAPGDPASGW